MHRRCNLDNSQEGECINLSQGCQWDRPRPIKVFEFSHTAWPNQFHIWIQTNLCQACWLVYMLVPLLFPSFQYLCAPSLQSWPWDFCYPCWCIKYSSVFVGENCFKRAGESIKGSCWWCTHFFLSFFFVSFVFSYEEGVFSCSQSVANLWFKVIGGTEIMRKPPEIFFFCYF